MKKVILILVFLASLAMTVKVSIYKHNQVFYDNLDALTEGESGRYDCYTLHIDEGNYDNPAIYVLICTGCDYRWVSYASLPAFCVK